MDVVYSLRWRQMGAIASQITSLMIVYSTADQSKHQSSASLAFVWGIAGEFPAQRASNAENDSIWWRHHVMALTSQHNTTVSTLEWLPMISMATSIFAQANLATSLSLSSVHYDGPIVRAQLYVKSASAIFPVFNSGAGGIGLKWSGWIASANYNK